MAPPVVLAESNESVCGTASIDGCFLTAARISSQLNEAGVEIQISINISANDLLDQEMPDLVDQSLKTWGVSPAAIQIEITETSMVQETETVGVVFEAASLARYCAVGRRLWYRILLNKPSEEFTGAGGED